MGRLLGKKLFLASVFHCTLYNPLHYICICNHIIVSRSSGYVQGGIEGSCAGSQRCGLQGVRTLHHTRHHAFQRPRRPQGLHLHLDAGVQPVGPFMAPAPPGQGPSPKHALVSMGLSLEKVYTRVCHRVSLIVHSSMFAVWGNRTHDAKLFSARNLDWNEDTGEHANASPAAFIHEHCPSLIPS